VREEFEIDDSVLIKYNGTRTDVTVPEGITKIQRFSFKNRTLIKSVKIPSSVRVIGYEAFQGCTALETVEIAEGVEIIDMSAFKGCTSLRRISLPDSIKKIEIFAFADCTSLEYNVCENVAYLGNSENPYVAAAFNYEPYGSTDIKLQEGVHVILEDAFDGSDITEINIPDSVSHIGSHAFSRCSDLKRVHLPKSLVCLDDHAFVSCASLEEIELPDTLEELGCGAFQFCDKLTHINIPAGVTVMRDEVFVGCDALVTNEYRGVKYLGSPQNPYILLLAATGDKVFDIHPDTKFIHYAAFKGNKAIDELTLPDGLVSIGSYAFYYSSVKSAKIPASVQIIRENAFSECKELKSVELTHADITIESWAFSYTGIQSITVECGMIDDHAFSDCEMLECATLLDGVVWLGDMVFGGCKNLKKITLPQSLNEDLKLFGWALFDDEYETEIILT